MNRQQLFHKMLSLSVLAMLLLGAIPATAQPTVMPFSYPPANVSPADTTNDENVGIDLAPAWPEAPPAHNASRAGSYCGNIERISSPSANADWEEVGAGSATGGGISDNSGFSMWPMMAVSPDGTPYIVWNDNSDGDYEIYVLHWDGHIWEEVGTGSATGGGISDNSGVSRRGAVAIGPNGTPYIAWYDDSSGDYEIYVRRWVEPTSCWHIETVDSAGDVGYSPSLALDAAGRPHIGYRDFYMNLNYAYHDGTSWITETVDSDGGIEPSLFLALDSAGRPHISYYRYPPGTLKYAYYDGTTWQIETVDSSGNMGSASSIALDPADQPHISYYDASNTALKYASYVGSGGNCGPGGNTWQCDIVDNSSSEGEGCSLALDSTDKAHIVHFLRPNGVGYAHYVGSGGNCSNSAWDCEVVDNIGGNVAPYVHSIAVDSTDRPHASYYDLTNSETRYTYRVGDGTGNCGSGNNWYCELVDSSDSGGGANSLALDAADRPHISYPGGPNGNFLMYAYHGGTSWITETVDSTGDVGRSTSLALDATGRPHISYYDADNGDLKYARPCFCRPVQDITISGPDNLVVDMTGIYTASYTPFTATLPVTITWDNGTIGPTAAYSWTTPGNYTVTVSATNACSQISDTLTVEVCQPVEEVSIIGPADLLVDETGVYIAPYSPPSTTLPVTLTWDNGTVGPTAAYSWTLPGSYSIIATATNPCGKVRDTFVVSVCQPVETVTIDGLADLLVDETGVYTAVYSPANTSPPVTFAWDNGTVGANAVYSWTLPGTYSIIVTATNPCGKVSDSFSVTVCAPAGEADFVWWPNEPMQDERVTFSGFAQGSEPIGYEWAFGEGNFGAGQTVTHTYAATGTYTVTMTATNDCGQDVAWYDITVTEFFTAPDIEVTPMALLAQLAPGGTTERVVTISNLGDENLDWALAENPAMDWLEETPVSGTVPVDGSTAVTVSFDASGLDVGIYATTIEITSNDPNETVVDVVTTLAVICDALHNVGFTWEPLTPIIGEEVTFEATATGTLPITFEWGFGDGTVTSGTTVTHTYTAAGTYSVTLTATNPCGQVREVRVIQVAASHPHHIFLPLVLKRTCTSYPPGPWVDENNNSSAEASGPLCSGIDYLAYPEDMWDYFYIVIEQGMITVQVSDYSATDGQLVIYNESMDMIGWDNDSSDGLYAESDGAQPAGKYYILIYTVEGQNQEYLYTLSLHFAH